MRAMRFHHHGTPDDLVAEDIPTPVPQAGEALVAVRACGLNFLDVFVMRGMPGLPVHMPRIPGGDIAGIVTAMGTAGDAAWIGRRVLVDPSIRVGRERGALGEHADGGLCEVIAVPAENLIAIPEGVSFAQAAAPAHRLRHSPSHAHRSGSGQIG